MKNNNVNFSIITTLIFAIIIAIGMHYHEMWRDELEIYSLLSNTNNIFLAGDISFIFYHSLIKLFLFISNSETMFQVFHLIVIVSALFLFLRYSNINKLQKLLISFSYFIVFEYGIISRYYGFMILLIFFIVYLINKTQNTKYRTKFNYLLIVILILILVNHSIQSVLFALSLSLYLVLDILKPGIENWKTNAMKFKVKNSYALILFIVGWIVLLLLHYLITYQNAHYIFSDNYKSAPILMNFRAIWNAFIPVPDLNSGVNFWNTNIFNFPIGYMKDYKYYEYLKTGNILPFIISILIITIISIKFSSKPIVLITFLFNIIIYLFFLESLKIYFIRYQGSLYIIFIYCYWLYNNEQSSTKYKQLITNKLINFSNMLFKPMIYIIFFAQVYSCFYALTFDIKNKFTNSQEAAKYIELNNLNKTHIIFGSVDYIVGAIAAQIHTKIYFPEIKKFNYYWEPRNKTRKKNLKIPDLFPTITNWTENQHKKVLIILSVPIGKFNGKPIEETMISTTTKIKFLKAFFENTIVKDEQYYLYECYTIRSI